MIEAGADAFRKLEYLIAVEADALLRWAVLDKRTEPRKVLSGPHTVSRAAVEWRSKYLVEAALRAALGAKG